MPPRRVSLLGSSYNDTGITPDHQNHWMNQKYTARLSIFQKGLGTQRNQIIGHQEVSVSGPGPFHTGQGPQNNHYHNASASGALNIGTQNVYCAANYSDAFPNAQGAEKLQQYAQHIVRALNIAQQQQQPQRGSAVPGGQPPTGGKNPAERQKTQETVVVEHVVRTAWHSLSEEEYQKIIHERAKATFHNATDAEITLLENAIRVYITICIERGFRHDEVTHSIHETATRWDTAWRNPYNNAHSDPVVVNILKWCNEGYMDMNEVRTLIANAPAKFVPVEPKKGRKSQDRAAQSQFRANGNGSLNHLLPQELSRPTPSDRRVFPKKSQHMEKVFQFATKSFEHQQFVDVMVEAHVQRLVKDGFTLQAAVRRIAHAAMWLRGKPIEGDAQDADRSMVSVLVNWGAKNNISGSDVKGMVREAAKKFGPRLDRNG
ncbi:uncharacterized protein BDZ99DRAFT_475280 [Mytilinidion resinicola]|uniref:Uncharacterized protein n=1 Tax=Mytilinidion resinicola TaxID=574789 RepID=A0A6A6YS44_9PEZI|nr:uncharacterized protein BDZ99DRAFT_475280 [Mytilinidion resinicola]KAF2811766.1 hypothetical protein BDZ99DRAFT_475280 [Mytilinidion resinicola]